MDLVLRCKKLKNSNKSNLRILSSDEENVSQSPKTISLNRKRSQGQELRSDSRNKVSIFLDKTDEQLEYDEDDTVENGKLDKNEGKQSEDQNFKSYFRKASSKLNHMLDTTGGTSMIRQEGYVSFKPSSLRHITSTSYSSRFISPKNDLKSNDFDKKLDYPSDLKSQTTRNQSNFFSSGSSTLIQNSTLSINNLMNSSSTNRNLKNKINTLATPTGSCRIIASPSHGTSSSSTKSNLNSDKKFFSSVNHHRNSVGFKKISMTSRGGDSIGSISEQQLPSIQSLNFSKSQKFDEQNIRLNSSNSKTKLPFRSSKQDFNSSNGMSTGQMKRNASQTPIEKIYVDEISENFRTSLNFIDLSEMKKIEFSEQQHIAEYTHEHGSQLKSEVLIRPNVQSLEQQLKYGKYNNIQLGMNEFTYFCIRVRGQPSPLRVRIKQEKLLHFKVIVSRAFATPSQFNCDFKLQGNAFSFESENNQTVFQDQEFFYFAIYSPEEAFARVSFFFGKQTDSPAYSKVLKEQKTTQSARFNMDFQSKVHDLSNIQLKKEVRDILEKRKMKIGKIGFGLDLIQKNIESLKVENLQEAAQTRINQIEIKKAKIISAQEQRVQLLERHIHDITSQKEEKEEKKKNMIIDKMIKIKQFQKKSFDFFWITNLVLVLATHKLAYKLQKHKERQRLMRDMAFSLLRPFFRYKIWIRNFGGNNIHSRVLVDSKYTSQAYAQIKKKKVKPKAEKVIAYAMQQNMWRFQAINQIINFHVKSKNVLAKLRTFHFKVNSFKKLLFRIWDKYYIEIIQEILEVKPEIAHLKDPTLSKRFLQNVYQSFNHLDHKRASIDRYYKIILDKFIQKLELPKKPSLIQISSQVQVKTARGCQEENQDDKNFFRTQVSIPVQIKLSKDSDLQDPKESQKEQLKKTSELQQSQLISPESLTELKETHKIIPRLFIIPSRAAIKDIIYYGVLGVYQQYSELQKKVNFKWKPTE